MDTEHAETELGDFAHQRAPYDTQWMDDRIKLFLGRNIVIARTEPADAEVTEHEGYAAAGSGPERASSSTSVNPNWLRNRALNLFTIADYLDHRDAILAAKEAEATSAQNKRRDELAYELFHSRHYSDLRAGAEKAVDRIIELEGAAK